MTGQPRKKWGGHAAAQLVKLTLATYGTTCHLCGLDGASTADHIVPRSAGGADSLDNLRPAHRKCNMQRGNMAVSAWKEKQVAGRLLPSCDWLHTGLHVSCDEPDSPRDCAQTCHRTGKPRNHPGRHLTPYGNRS